jgi:hypothetical protein
MMGVAFAESMARGKAKNANRATLISLHTILVFINFIVVTWSYL